MLENAKMAKDVTLNAEEVAEKLYHHDAACRIIARLTAQMAETRANLAQFQRETSQAAEHPQTAHVEMAEEPEEKGITDAIMERLKQTGDVRLTFPTDAFLTHPCSETDKSAQKTREKTAARTRRQFDSERICCAELLPGIAFRLRSRHHLSRCRLEDGQRGDRRQRQKRRHFRSFCWRNYCHL